MHIHITTAGPKKRNDTFEEPIGIKYSPRGIPAEVSLFSKYRDEAGHYQDATLVFETQDNSWLDSAGNRRDTLLVNYAAQGSEPEPVETAYDHELGSGNRTALITVTSGGHSFFGTLANLVNGVTNSGGIFALTNPNTNAFVAFEFPYPVVIDEFKSYQSGNAAYGNHKWQGSNNGTDWTDIGDQFDWGGSGGSPFTGTSMAGNQTAYLHYRAIGVGPNQWSATDLYEIEFKIGS